MIFIGLCFVPAMLLVVAIMLLGGAFKGNSNPEPTKDVREVILDIEGDYLLLDIDEVALELDAHVEYVQKLMVHLMVPYTYSKEHRYMYRCCDVRAVKKRLKEMRSVGFWGVGNR